MQLKEWLEKTDMSVARFAQMIDVERSYLHQILRNPNIASKRLLWRIYRVSGEQIELFEKLKEKKCSPNRMKNSQKRSKMP